MCSDSQLTDHILARVQEPPIALKPHSAWTSVSMYCHWSASSTPHTVSTGALSGDPSVSD